MLVSQTGSHFAALRDDDWNFGFIVRSGWNVFYFPNDEQTLDDPAKDDVFLVKEVAFGARDEELAAVGVFTRIRHRQQPGAGMLQPEVLVREVGTVYAGKGSKRDAEITISLRVVNSILVRVFKSESYRTNSKISFTIQLVSISDINPTCQSLSKIQYPIFHPSSHLIVPVPSPLTKSPPWIMKSLMTR